MKLFLYLIFFLLVSACGSRRAVQTFSSRIITKDTVVVSEKVRLDTVVKTLSDTIRKQKLVFAYRYDTIRRQMKVHIYAPPETIRIPQTFVKITEMTTKPEKDARHKQRKKKRSLWFVGILAGFVGASILLLILNFQRIIKKIFSIPL